MSRLRRICRFPVTLLTLYAVSMVPVAGSIPLNEPSHDTSLATDQRVRQVLSRLTFGALPGNVERVTKMGVDKFIAEQLDPDSIDDSALQKRLDRLPTLRLDAPDLAAQYNPPKPPPTPTPVPGATPAAAEMKAATATMTETRMEASAAVSPTPVASPTPIPKPTPSAQESRNGGQRTSTGQTPTSRVQRTSTV